MAWNTIGPIHFYSKRKSNKNKQGLESLQIMKVWTNLKFKRSKEKIKKKLIRTLIIRNY